MQRSPDDDTVASRTAQTSGRPENEMQKSPDDDAVAPSPARTSGKSENEMRRLNEDTVKVIALLNSALEPTGINQYETLRRIVREDQKLKEAYRGVVNPGRVVTNAVQVFATRAASEAGAQGGTRLDDVLKENAPQKVLEEIVKDILPSVISSHVQDYMATERTPLR